MEKYSRPLSDAARAALVDFIAIYAESMASTLVDEKAEEAKRKAIVCLQTDIDILVFVTTISMMLQGSGKALLLQMMHGLTTPRGAATTIVQIVERAIVIDKAGRP
jgi:hypothetical protein